MAEAQAIADAVATFAIDDAPDPARAYAQDGWIVEDLLTTQAQERTAEVGEAVQTALARYVLNNPGVAVSPMVMGLDTLSSMLQRDGGADMLASFGPGISAIVDLYNYCIGGTDPTDGVRAILAGDLSAIL